MPKPSAKKPNGFTLAEALVSFTCSLMTLSIVYAACMLCLRLILPADGHQDDMAILQIRQEAVLSSDLSVADGILQIQNGAHSCQILFDHSRMIKKPGYEILMENVQSGMFIQRSEGILLCYEKENRKVQIWIA